MDRPTFPASFGEATAEAERAVAWLRLPAIALIALGESIGPNEQRDWFLVVLALRVPIPIANAWSASQWWLWTGGLLGALYISAAVVLAPRLGAATLVAAVVAGQMAASLVLDHFGWVGFPEHPVNGLRLLGASLVILGVVLVQR